MQWVGTSASMALGASISVRTFVTTRKTVLAALQVQPNGLQTMQWVGASATIILGAFRCVRAIVTVCTTVLAIFETVREFQ